MNSLQVVFSDNDDSFLNLLIQDPPPPPPPASLVVFLLVHVFACLELVNMIMGVHLFLWYFSAYSALII
jgi:hypothetical protein